MAEETEVTNGTSPEPTTPQADDTAQPENETKEPKTFTQAELEKHIADRLKRERDKYKDYKDLQAAKSELDKIKEAQLTETERLQKQLAQAEEKARELEVMARERLINSEIVSLAAKANFANPQDAVLLVDRSDIDLDDEGNVKGVGDAIKGLIESRPYLVKQGNRQLEPFEPSSDSSKLRETDDERRRRLFDPTQNIFTMDVIEQQGGGVIWSKQKED